MRQFVDFLPDVCKWRVEYLPIAYSLFVNDALMDDDASFVLYAVLIEAQPNDAVASMTMYVVDSVASMPWVSFDPIAVKIVKRDLDEVQAVA